MNLPEQNPGVHSLRQACSCRHCSLGPLRGRCVPWGRLLCYMRRGNELDVDEEYDNDGTLAMYESRAKKGDKEQQAKREKTRQISDYRWDKPH